MGLQTDAVLTRGVFNLRRTERTIAQTLERLSTGKRINHAADDPAGLIAVENFKLKEIDLTSSIAAAEMDLRYMAAREGALAPVADMLIELQSYVIRSAGDTASPAEREAMQVQADSILQTIDRLGQTATFKGVQILQHIGTTRLGVVNDTNPDGSTTTFSLASLKSGGELALGRDGEKAQAVVRGALDAITRERGDLGAKQNDFDHRINAMRVELENTVAARGGIEDADFAQETATLIRERTKQQATIMVQQMAADLRAQSVLELLRSVHR